MSRGVAGGWRLAGKRMTTGGTGGDVDIRSLRIERTGGLAGIPVSVDVDVATLTAAQRKALDKVSQATPMDPTTAIIGSMTRGADRLHYRLHVLQSDGQKRVLELSEDDMPQALGMLAKLGLP